MACNWLDADIVCPFYRKTVRERRCIVCEGPQDGSTVQLNFEEDTARLRWILRRCADYSYEGCPIAKMAAEKYEER